jgi:hypothetical protein
MFKIKLLRAQNELPKVLLDTLAFNLSLLYEI